jgi:ATP citrate (pro-S)-lyase
MITIDRIRTEEGSILAAGNHQRIIQSILDFDYLCGKKYPSVAGIIASNRRVQKFFFGTSEILIPCYRSISSCSLKGVDWLLNMHSGRRTFDTTTEFFERYPKALGAHIFAENVPERHATHLIRLFGKKHLTAGPSGVGLVIPGRLKLGAIGGIDPSQLEASKLTTPGSIAVVSTSGGMTNELIRSVVRAGKRVSFSVSIGGDRFPVTSLGDFLALAEEDAATKGIVYFGELGGSDEYEIAGMLERGEVTKPVLCYIAGVIDEAFDEHMQFGHAKALVARTDESAQAKKNALRAAGATAPDTFPQFLEEMKRLPGTAAHDRVIDTSTLMQRKSSILSTREVVDLDAIPRYVKGGKLAKQKENAFAASLMHALLGRDVSPVTAAFVANVLDLLIDHGGHVSGAVNTMVTARAGKDMVSSLAAGLLTIGPRFGGALNAAASTWLDGESSGMPPNEFVEMHTKGGALLSGIGHRKYRVGIPDPRVEALSAFAALLKKHPHYDFARAVEKVTTAKNGNLILNVDGVIAALLLDILSEKDGLGREELHELADAEFFNALFVIPRSVGFIAHFLEQKRNDEGLFRLPDELLYERKGRGGKKHVV